MGVLGRRDVWSGLLMLAAGGAVAWSAAGLGIGSLSQPGSGFLGFYCGLAILGLGAVVFVGALRAAGAPSLRQALSGMGGAPLMLLPMIAFCLVLEPLGFLIAGFLLMLWLFALSFGSFRSPWPVLWSLAATLGCWLLFDRLLGSELPPLPF